MCVISGIGVIILNLVFNASIQAGTYFSNSTTRAAFSVTLCLVSIQLETYGFQPRSVGFMYKIPARDTVAGVADRKFDISNNNRMEGVRAIRSLLANVSTCKMAKIKSYVKNIFYDISLRTLLSSITVFNDSIHMGSISPSITIHLDPSPGICACSLIRHENNPVQITETGVILFKNIFGRG